MAASPRASREGRGPEGERASRLFLALWLQDEAVAHLDRALTPVRADSPDWLRWQPTARWHITVCFLGDRTDCQRRRVERVAARAATAALARPVRLEAAGRFSAILWIGVRTGGWLAHLGSAVGRELLPPAERRPLQAHVSVARSRRGPVPTAAVSALAGYRGPPWLPQRLSLVSSQLGPEPRYTTEAEWGLRAAGASSRPDR